MEVRCAKGGQALNQLAWVQHEIVQAIDYAFAREGARRQKGRKLLRSQPAGSPLQQLAGQESGELADGAVLAEEMEAIA